MTQNRAKPYAKKRVNDAKRARAMQLLADGCHLVDVARELDVGRGAVRFWRDSPEGQRMLAEARAKRAVEFEDAATEARRLIRENLTRAVQALVDDLRVPARRRRAAQALLDRGGVSAVTTVGGELGIRGLGDLLGSLLAPPEGGTK